MSLTDIMGEMKLYVYPEVALILFLIAFILVIVHTVNKKNRDRFDKARFMPLDDDTPQEPRDAEATPRDDKDDGSHASMSAADTDGCAQGVS